MPLRLGRCLGEYRGHVDLVLVETQDLVPMPLGCGEASGGLGGVDRRGATEV